MFERGGQLYMRDLTKKDAKTVALKLEVKSDVRHSGVVQRTVTSGGEQVHISADGQGSSPDGGTVAIDAAGSVAGDSISSNGSKRRDE